MAVFCRGRWHLTVVPSTLPAMLWCVPTTRSVSLFLSPSLSFFVSSCLSLPLANGRDAMFYSVHTCAKPNVNDPGLSTLVLLSR